VGARHRQVLSLQPGRKLSHMGQGTADSAVSLPKAGGRLDVATMHDIRELTLSHFGFREIAFLLARL
jgi:hypothetical protein